jgi:hypothetical protein
MQHLDGSGAWPSYIQDARFLKVNGQKVHFIFFNYDSTKQWRSARQIDVFRH